MLTPDVYAASYLLLLFIATIYAAVKGGAPERWAAGVLFVGVLLSNVAMVISRTRFSVPEIGVMAVDGMLTVAFGVLALRANRFWPMPLVAIQADSMLVHLVMFSGQAMPFSYALMLRLFSLPLPLIIAVGVLRHRLRLRQWSSDRAWSRRGLAGEQSSPA